MKKVERLFLVDDDHIFLMIMKRMIIQTDAVESVDSFENGSDILEYLKANLSNSDALPDIILLDLNMPIMDGWQFLDAYREIQDQLARNIRIYILSSSNFDEDIRKTVEYPMVTEYLVKPLNPEKLTEILRS